jgi:hypothetical protein
MYKPEKTYTVVVELVDKTTDVFSLKGADMEEFHERVYVQGYKRKTGQANVFKLISPYVIADITVTEN